MNWNLIIENAPAIIGALVSIFFAVRNAINKAKAKDYKGAADEAKDALRSTTDCIQHVRTILDPKRADKMIEQLGTAHRLVGTRTVVKSVKNEAPKHTLDLGFEPNLKDLSKSEGRIGYRYSF